MTLSLPSHSYSWETATLGSGRNPDNVNFGIQLAEAKLKHECRQFTNWHRQLVGCVRLSLCKIIESLILGRTLSNIARFAPFD
ncbi:MAG TPA: hypothetical protein VK211_16455 [Kamptonema sp.]|nr:hypothetical protein [Kamptonema sp.]